MNNPWPLSQLRTERLKNSAVAIWPVTGQGFQNTNRPAVLSIL